jgi:hypothetical protein
MDRLDFGRLARQRDQRTREQQARNPGWCASKSGAHTDQCP